MAPSATARAVRLIVVLIWCSLLSCFAPAPDAYRASLPSLGAAWEDNAKTVRGSLRFPRPSLDDGGRRTHAHGGMPRRTAQEQAALVARLNENAADVLAGTADRGAISFQSPSVERVLGYRPDELEGTSVFDLVHPEDLSGAAIRMTQVQEEVGPTRVSLIRLRHRDGSYR